MKSILYHYGLLYISENTYSEIISCYYNDPLTSYFRIKNVKILVDKKYFWSIFHQNVKAYVKGYDVYLALKTVCYKSYKDLQLLLIPSHYWKNVFMYFMISFLLLVDWKDKSYDPNLVIIYCLIKMV